MKKSAFFIISLLTTIGLANAQWQQANGPYYSTINSIAVSGSNIFTGTYRGIVYLSGDTGKTWIPTNMPISFSLDIEGSKMYTADDNLLFVSDDNGENYDTIDTGLPDGCNTYLVDAVGRYIFVHTENNGTVFSSDSGASWTPITLGWNVSSFMQFEENLFAGTGDGVYVSADSGMTWNLTSLEGKYISSLLTNGTWILAGSDVSGIYKSDDKGLTWAPSDTGLNHPYVTSLILNGTDIYAGTSEGGVYWSTNDAASWEQISSGFPDAVQISCLASFDNKIFAGTSACGIFLTENNGVLWAHLNYELGEPADIYSMVVKGGNIVAGTSLCGIHTSDNAGNDWTLSNIAHGIYTLVEEGSNIYAGTTNGVYLSVDNGITWVSKGLPGTWITAIAIADNIIFVGTEQGVLLSDDGGLTWEEANNGIPDHTHIYCLAVKGTYLFAGSFDSGAYLSTDYGLSWTNASIGLPYDFVRSFFVDGENIFAGDWWHGVYLSTDNGTSWNFMGLEDKCVRSFVMSGNILFAGTWEHGVYVSYDHGVSWNEINTGLTNLHIESLALDANYLYAGTSWEGGVWKRHLSEMVEIGEWNENENIKVYPNPAKNEINIEDTRLNPEAIISIFNLEGQLVMSQKLINSKTKIDLINLNNGIYLLKVSDRDKTEVIKFFKE